MANADDQKIVKKLDDVRKETPELADVIDLQQDLLKARMNVNVTITTPHYSEDTTRARFAQRIPLLRPEEMAVDSETFSDLYQQVCRITAEHRPDLAHRFAELHSLLDDDPEKVRTLASTYLEKGTLMVSGEARGSFSADEIEQRELLNFVLTHALGPFLKAYAGALTPILEQQLGPDWDNHWQDGKCPICGGEPDLAFLDEESGARHLVCSRCDSHWLFPRIKCPFCSISEPEMLTYFATDDKVYRVYTCQNCQRYLKAVDLRRAGRRLLFPVERVTMVDLDVAARDKGYF
jgi:FdhE protein